MVKQLGSKLRDIDPFAFETLVAQLYIIDGYSVRVTKKTGDGKKDLLAVDLNDDKTKIIECKRYGSNSNIKGKKLSKICKEINDFADKKGIINYDITIITTSRHRYPSTNKVASDNNVEYIGGDTLINRLKRLNAEYLVDCYTELDTRLDTFDSIQKRFNILNITAEDELIYKILDNPNRLEIITYIECMSKGIELEHLADIEKILTDYDLSYK